MDYKFIIELMQNSFFFSYGEQEILQADKRTNNGELWCPVDFQ